jgi:hypothetical protein
MKKYILIIPFAILLSTTTGCESFLDDQPRGNAIAQTTDNYNGMFNTIEFMNMKMEDYTHFFIDDIQLTPDNISQFPVTVSSCEVESIIRAFSFDKNVYKVTENCNALQLCYKNIYTYNVIANGVMNSVEGTEARKKAILAEARISRAWMHFIAAQMFSKPYNKEIAETELTLPIVTKANTFAGSYERATMKEYYDFIINEMEESCPELEDRPNHNMRVYMTAGYALLGKMYWMIGEYEKALKPLRIAYERSKNEAKSFFLQDFNNLQAKYGYRELTAAEIQKAQGTTNTDLLPYTYANPEVLWVKQNTCFSMGLFYFTSNGTITYYFKPECYSLFDDYDLRRNLIPTKDINGNTTLYPVGCIRDGSVNYGVSLAEVYLALAECEARKGSETNARKVLTEFRANRMLKGHEEIPAKIQTKEQLVRFCLDEQRREFMGRENRYYNIRRLWDDPLFQSEKPIKHNDGINTYTLQDAPYISLPESILKWNENWR